MHNLIAYIDPVSGSILLQLLIAGFVGIVGFFRKSIFAVFGRFRKTAKATTDE